MFSSFFFSENFSHKQTVTVMLQVTAYCFAKIPTSFPLFPFCSTSCFESKEQKLFSSGILINNLKIQFWIENYCTSNCEIQWYNVSPFDMKSFQRVKFWFQLCRTSRILNLKTFHASDNGFKHLKRFLFSESSSHSYILVSSAFCAFWKVWLWIVKCQIYKCQVWIRSFISCQILNQSILNRSRFQMKIYSPKILNLKVYNASESEK